MNKSAYRIFILSCEGIGLHGDHDPNGSYELFGLVPIPIEWFRLAALALWVGFCEVWMGMLAWGFVVIACATADAVAEATLVMSLHVSATWVWRKAFNSLSCCSCLYWPSKSDCRNGLFFFLTEGLLILIRESVRHDFQISMCVGSSMYSLIFCEGNTEMRPLVYRDSLRWGRAEQM